MKKRNLNRAHIENLNQHSGGNCYIDSSFRFSKFLMNVSTEMRKIQLFKTIPTSQDSKQGLDALNPTDVSEQNNFERRNIWIENFVLAWNNILLISQKVHLSSFSIGTVGCNPTRSFWNYRSNWKKIRVTRDESKYLMRKVWNKWKGHSFFSELSCCMCFKQHCLIGTGPNVFEKNKLKNAQVRISNFVLQVKKFRVEGMERNKSASPEVSQCRSSDENYINAIQPVAFEKRRSKKFSNSKQVKTFIK